MEENIESGTRNRNTNFDSINSTNEIGINPSGTIRNESAPLLSSRSNIFDRIKSIFRTSDINQNERTLKTLAGVFAPVALSQFSTLLFLRIGFIVGNLGIYLGVSTFILAYLILTMTILSICAISTNGAIEGGGAYFMISRTLGPEFGGAIGALFFFANVFSSALYTTGCVEGMMQYFGENAGDHAIARVLPEGGWYYFGYGSSINGINLIVCFIGAGMFAKTTILIFATVFICALIVLASFWHSPLEVPIPSTNELFYNETGAFTGFSWHTFNNNTNPSFTTDYTTGDMIDFATVFGVLFSGVTGIMAGANMSGELKAPSVSIPRGTFYATCGTLIVYIFLVILCGSTCSRFLLQNNYGFMMEISFLPDAVCVGIITATLSASLSNLIGASRVLAALAKDNLYGKMISWIGLMSCRNNPIGAVVVSFVLVECVLLIGELNTIARFTSVFFLVSYMATNLACFGLEWASAPNFRPTFQYFSIYTAGLGIISNLVMMFVISAAYSGICIIIVLLLIIFLHLRTPVEANEWGSISQALIYHQVRKYLLLLDTRKDHVKFWRPQILLLVSDPRAACPLIDFVNDMKKSGLYILGHVKVGEYTGEGKDPAAIDFPQWQALVDYLKVKAFIEITVSPTVRSGMQQLVRVAGLGAMKPNIVILGFLDDSTPADFIKRRFASLNSVTDPNETALQILETSGEATPYIVIPETKKRNSNKERVVPAILKKEASQDKSSSKINAVEYVTMLNDILNMEKNLCLCRHFPLLDKQAILRKSNREKPYIDIWPMNFFEPNEAKVFDTSSLVLMQMSTVLNMVSTWSKRTQVRVFVCVSDSSIESTNRKEVKEKLESYRMKATITFVPWANISSLRKKSGEQNIQGASSTETASATSTGTSDFNESYQDLSDNYLKGVNQMIREHSVNTGVTFMYLPRPPKSEYLFEHYMKSLSTMTEHLHPTILVHGIMDVTTGEL